MQDATTATKYANDKVLAARKQEKIQLYKLVRKWRKEKKLNQNRKHFSLPL